MGFPASSQHALPIWLQPEHDLQDASELLNFIRKQPRGCPTQQLLDSYKGVEDDLKVGWGFGYPAETCAFLHAAARLSDEQVPELVNTEVAQSKLQRGNMVGSRLHRLSTGVAGTQQQHRECAAAKQQ